MDHEFETEEKGLSERHYANYFEIGFNAFEFLLDFGQFYPGDKKARREVRIITSPAYAKSLLETLRESLDRYEQSFGVIGKGET